MAERQVVRSYRTDFPTDEDPVSEDGMWLNGKKDAIDWTDCIVSNGFIHGAPSRMNVLEKRSEQGNLGDEEEAPVGDYDDPTSVLSGEWGPNQHGKATAHVENPTEDWFQEVQIRLRHTVQPSSISGYEIFFRCLKGELGYAEIVRWNPTGDVYAPCTALDGLPLFTVGKFARTCHVSGFVPVRWVATTAVVSKPLPFEHCEPAGQVSVMS